MFVELPQNLILLAVGAFLFGWILSAINAGLNARQKAKKRDPRDDRLRELEAELRIARSEKESATSGLATLEEQLSEATASIESRDNVITEQQSRAEKLSNDLKESVLKTRELRAELADRATENVHAEAKIREVEVELSVAQASTDMIATGILDYSLPDDEDNPEQSNDELTHQPAANAGKAVN